MAHEETVPCFEQWPSLLPSPARSLRRLLPRPSRPLAGVAAGTAAEGMGEDTAAAMPGVMPAATLADTPSMAASTVPATSPALSQRGAASSGSAAFITSRISAAAFGARACMPITAIIVAGVGFQAAGVMYESGSADRRRGAAHRRR